MTQMDADEHGLLTARNAESAMNAKGWGEAPDEPFYPTILRKCAIWFL
jgi:hypothetical protein